MASAQTSIVDSLSSVEARYTLMIFSGDIELFPSRRSPRRPALDIAIFSRSARVEIDGNGVRYRNAIWSNLFVP